MKFGYISADFGVDLFGSAGNSVHVRELIEALRRAGHAVHFVSPALSSREPPTAHRLRPGAPAAVVEPLPPEPHHLELFRQLEALDELLGRTTRVRHELRNLLYNLTLHERGLESLRAAGVACVYERYAFASFAGIRVARALGVPHLLEVNAPLSEEQARRAGVEMPELARDLERRIFCESDHLFAVSRNLRDFALERGVAPERISVLPNAVDPARFEVVPERREALRRRLGIHDRCVLGFVGGLKHWHGTELLIEAFAALRMEEPAVHLLVVGDGPAGERLRGLTRDRGLARDVTFTGSVSHPEVAEHIGAMDVAVAPGVPDADFYFSPLKLFEYMAAGRAVVAGANGQPAELIEDGRNGRLFAPGDAPALAKLLVELVRAPETRRRLGEQARAQVLRRHTWDHNAAEVVAAAHRLVGSGV